MSSQYNRWMAIEDRLWPRTDKSSGCWLWLGPKDTHGYGVIGYKGRTCSTHRVSYTLTKGDPTGLEVCHVCDIPSCINPDHLFLGTRLENQRDCLAKGRYSKHGAKITEDMVREIRNKYKPWKYTQEQLALEYGVTRIQIGRIINNQRWKDVI